MKPFHSTTKVKSVATCSPIEVCSLSPLHAPEPPHELPPVWRATFSERSSRNEGSRWLLAEVMSARQAWPRRLRIISCRQVRKAVERSTCTVSLARRVLSARPRQKDPTRMRGWRNMASARGLHDATPAFILPVGVLLGTWHQPQRRQMPSVNWRARAGLRIRLVVARSSLRPPILRRVGSRPCAFAAALTLLVAPKTSPRCFPGRDHCVRIHSTRRLRRRNCRTLGYASSAQRADQPTCSSCRSGKESRVL